MGETIIITIDGTVGVGKSTVARALARRLGYFHLDTGAMYRTVTLMASRRGLDLDDASALTALARDITIEMEYRDESLVVLCDGEDISRAIRTPEVSANTSPVSDVRGVREQLVTQQRDIAQRHGKVVAEGRDMSTVVFPDADWKFYLDANISVRTHRRYKQLQQDSPGTDVSFEEIMRSLIQRDNRDRARPFGPLRVSGDAIVIDTSGISQERVIAIMAGMVEEKNDARS